MKLPSDVSTAQLIRVLQHLGYEVVRQKGSHIRLQHPGPPRHSVSVPNHSPLKKGALHGIASDVARARSISVDTILMSL